MTKTRQYDHDSVRGHRSRRHDVDVVDRYLRMIHDDARVEPSEMATLEADFIDAAARFASRNLISAEAWRDVGLPDELIQRAGLDL